MSSSDDAAPRLSSALDEVLGGRAADAGREQPVTSRGVDDHDDGSEAPVPLPRIVPATDDHPIEDGAPRLPRGASVASPVPPTAPAADRGQAPIPARTAGPTPVAAPSRPATAWGDHLPVGSPAPGTAPQLRSPGRRPRVRRVTRVVRHIDPWSTFKVGLVFSLVAYVVGLTSGVLLWRVADSTGTLANVERWFTQFGWETFELKGGEIFHNAWIMGLFGVVALTGGLVLLATLFNLVSDIVGGVRVTVLEEEVVERTVSSTRRYVVRRPPLGAADAELAPATWSVDGDDAGSPDHVVPASTAAPGIHSDWSVDDD